VVDKNCCAINFNETMTLLILIVKFCVMENYMLPGFSHDEKDFSEDPENIPEKNLSSSVSHNELSLVVKETLPGLLFHFEIENDVESDKGNNTFFVDSSCGISYRPLGSKRMKIAEYLLMVLNFYKDVPEEVDTVLSAHPQVYKLFLDYLFEFEWNNAYQLHFDNLFRYVMTNYSKFPNLIKTVN